MKKFILSLIYILIQVVLMQGLRAQQKIFNEVVGLNGDGAISSIIQDKQGYIWYGCLTSSRAGTGLGGLHRYGSSGTTSYYHKPGDINSLNDNSITALATDPSGIIWIATGEGLDRFNPITQTFSHFRYNMKDPGSLSNDNVLSLLIDHSNNLWVGTRNGLNLMNRATSKFIHYTFKPNDPSSLSSNIIYKLYEDREGTLWISCIPEPRRQATGGLVSFNPATKKFTRFEHDAANPKSISNNNVTAMLNDSHGNFWIGTGNNDLQIMNRATGIFTDYTNISTNAERRNPSQSLNGTVSSVLFIIEDANGLIWTGSSYSGIKKYNPETKKIINYGTSFPKEKSGYDTVSGFNNFLSPAAFISKDSLLWISGGNGNLYIVNPYSTKIPYYHVSNGARSFYQSKGGDLWIATIAGLLYKPVHGKEKVFLYNPKQDKSSILSNRVDLISPDSSGNLWFTTGINGLYKFNPEKEVFTQYRHDPFDKTSLGSNVAYQLYFDHHENLWISTDSGLDKMNVKTGEFIHYINDPADSNSLGNNHVARIVRKNDILWVGSGKGINKFNVRENKWQHYLTTSSIKSIFIDSKNVVWVGTIDGLYWYDSLQNKFNPFINSATGNKIIHVLNIIEDNSQNLWITTTPALYRIGPDRHSVTIFGSEYGIHFNSFFLANNFKGQNGELFVGDNGGYYAFYPDSLHVKMIPPTLYITGFQLGDKDVQPGPHSPIQVPIFEAKEINLNHEQNSFSFDFDALHYATPGEVKYQYILEGYDRWHDAGESHKVYYFNVPPGKYTFKVRAISSNGAWSEKDLTVVINPPWWVTWWAIVIYILILTGIIWAIVYFRSRQLKRKNKILEDKVTQRTAQLNQSLENLKSTQAQLIQSEKMASLGELTAGIAHEIQNPLNFVNNFSDVNKELIGELVEEVDKKNYDEVKLIAGDIKENSEKINHHGKRAGDIVKGMLQHSRKSTGQKEPTDINALADEYLRLSYHGLRAKDKSFNAEMKTDFDESIGKIDIIPQDIGRVLLNLYNNAFYAVNEQKKTAGENYEPTVMVTTERFPLSFGEGRGEVVIKVKDNGPGIPQKIIDKIFQPFFTTKPTGSGTGLGLSLSYDIVKAHGGEIKVESKEGEGSSFIIMLPTG